MGVLCRPLLLDQRVTKVLTLTDYPAVRIFSTVIPSYLDAKHLLFIWSFYSSLISFLNSGHVSAHYFIT